MSLFLFQCVLSNTKTKVVFENKSDLQIDSVVLTINKYRCKIANIGPAERRTREILKDSIDTNKHDVMVRGFIFVNGNLIKDEYHYNDLSGSISESYTLTLNRDLTVSLK